MSQEGVPYEAEYSEVWVDNIVDSLIESLPEREGWTSETQEHRVMFIEGWNEYHDSVQQLLLDAKDKNRE